MKNSVHPVPLLLFLAVVALIIAYQIYFFQGAVLFLVSTVVFAWAAGWLIGRRWRMYPWQIGLLGAVPAAAYMAWRFTTQSTPEESASNISLFVFHPLLVLISGHFGGLVGRWQALRSRMRGNGRD